jgi:hypothetical protein
MKPAHDDHNRKRVPQKPGFCEESSHCVLPQARPEPAKSPNYTIKSMNILDTLCIVRELNRLGWSLRLVWVREVLH